MKITMMLADHATAIAGRLFIHGGGWNVAPAGRVTCAVALIVELPYDERNKDHKLVLELLDADGQPVRVDQEGQTSALRLQGTLRAEDRGVVEAGTPACVSIAFNVQNVMLNAGRYEWRFWINGQTKDEWRLPFATRAAASG